MERKKRVVNLIERIGYDGGKPFSLAAYKYWAKLRKKRLYAYTARNERRTWEQMGIPSTDPRYKQPRLFFRHVKTEKLRKDDLSGYFFFSKPVVKGKPDYSSRFVLSAWRDNPELVKMVKTLGDKVNGTYTTYDGYGGKRHKLKRRLEIFRLNGPDGKPHDYVIDTSYDKSEVGGSSFSHEAHMLYAEKRGMKLYAYDFGRSPDKPKGKIRLVPYAYKPGRCADVYSHKSIGPDGDLEDDGWFHLAWVWGTDPVLCEVVEELGEKANNKGGRNDMDIPSWFCVVQPA